MSKNLQKSFTFLLVICLVLSSSINIAAADDQGISNAPQSMTTIFSTDFEADNGGFTSGGSANEWEWGELTSSWYGPGNAASGVKGWGTDLDSSYSNNSNCYIESPEIDLTNVSDAQLTFNHWHYFEGGSYDYGTIQVSTDNGANWTEIERYDSSRESSDWALVNISLNAYVGNKVKIRFNLKSDSSQYKDGWYIDDVAVSGTLAGPVPPTITTPADTSYANLNTVTITGTVEVDGVVNVYVNEVLAISVSSVAGEFTSDITLNEGENIITATTIVGEEETRHSDPITIVKDTVLPVLTITSPPDGFETVESVEVIGTVTEDNLDNVTVNGNAVEVGEDGSFTAEVLIDQDVNIITVIATDLAGNSVNEVITVNKASYEQPVITHEAITSTFAGLDLKVEAFVINDEEVTNVEILVKNDNMTDWMSIPMTLSSGSNLKGTYEGTISKDYVIYPGFEYRIESTDISSNLGQTEIYNVEGVFGIAPGEYSTDFTEYPEGWTLGGDWEWGHPTAGPVLPEGDNAIGTNLDGNYSTYTLSTLIMPPIDLRNSEEASLWFDRWYELYGSDTVTISIEISIDNGQTWEEPLAELKGEDELWKKMAIDLNPYVGSENQVWVAFKLDAQSWSGYDGLFLDNIELKGVDTESPSAPTGLGLEVNDAGIVTLNWTESTDADLKRYDVYRSTLSGEGYEFIGSTETTSYSDSDAIGGNTNYYIVKAYDFSENESEASNEASIDVPPTTIFYFSDFEADNGGLLTDGLNNSWAWGIPASGPYNSASGEKVWATNLSGDYSTNSNCYIEIPEMDLNNLKYANLSFSEWHEFEGSSFDYGTIEVSIDNGANWSEIQRYDSSRKSSDWQSVNVSLNEYIGQLVKIRFVLTSDSGSNRDGWYIDDVTVYGEALPSSPVILTPVDGAITNQETIELTGTVETDGPVNVYVNGELALTVDSVNNEFTTVVSLTEGENIISTTLVVDTLETEKSTPVTVIRDSILPVLEILSPQEELTTNNEVVLVSGIAVDDNLTSITVNGEAVEFSEHGSFVAEVELQEGENIITIIAADIAENSVTATRTITFDKEADAPTITDIQPSADLVVEAGDEVEVSFHSDAIGGSASFRLLIPATISITSNNDIQMTEVESGHYVGTWIVPEGIQLQGIGVEVKVTSTEGITTTNLAEGKISVMLVGDLESPVLLSDTTDNTVEEAIDITFTDDLAWRGLITDITVDGVSINGNYTLTEGNINIDSSVFTEAKNYVIVVMADGYEDAVVNQEIEEEEILVPGIEIINGEYVSHNRPVIIKGIANEVVDWEINIFDPNGTLVDTLTGTGMTFEGSWGPNEFKKLNGQYTVEVNEIVDGTIILTEEFTINVYNYPIKINSIEIVEQNGYVAIEAAIENLGPDTQSPMLVIQVKDEQDRVVSITTAKMEGLLQNYIVKLSSGFRAPGAGTYTVDIFVWTGWDNTEALSSPETATFTIE